MYSLPCSFYQKLLLRTGIYIHICIYTCLWNWYLCCSDCSTPTRQLLRSYRTIIIPIIQPSSCITWRCVRFVSGWYQVKGTRYGRHSRSYMDSNFICGSLSSVTVFSFGHVLSALYQYLPSTNICPLPISALCAIHQQKPISALYQYQPSVQYTNKNQVKERNGFMSSSCMLIKNEHRDAGPT